MPYGPILKGSKETASQTATMERCVNDLMKTGKDKSSAIAICKISLRKSMMRKQKQ